MSAAGDAERLPPSIGGLVEAAYSAYAAYARVYLGLALLVFVIGGIVEYALPPAALDSAQGQIKVAILEYSSIAIDAFVVAAIAVGVGGRFAGARTEPGNIIAVATARWLPVLVVLLILQAVVEVTAPLSAVGPLPDPPALAIVTAPITWLVWAMLALAAPMAALSDERPAFAVLGALGRAVGLSLRPANLPRLGVVAFASIVPYLLQSVAYDVMTAHHVVRPLFWANVPIDALTIGPVAAIQTVFALDFVRRGAQRSA